MSGQITLSSPDSPRRPGKMARLGASLRWFLTYFGLFSFLFVVSALSGAYRGAAGWLTKAEYSANCDYIVLLPAGPVPNSATLARAYKTAEEYAKNPSATVIISHVMEERYIGSTLWTIKRELMLRGVPERAILMEMKARSTNEHAQYIKEAALGDYQYDNYLLVTSPLHIRRSVMAFKAVGFEHVYAAASAGGGGAEDLGSGLFFRYRLWDRLIEQIGVAREFAAIIFYKLRGWA